MNDLLFIPFQDYLKQLCIQHVDVLHVDFVHVACIRFQSDEDLNQLPHHAGSMLVVVDNFIGRAVGDPDQQMMRQIVTLLFLKRTATGTTGDPAGEVMAAQTKALDVMFQFYARMCHDKQVDDCGILRYLNTESMNWAPVDGPVLENHYGWEMSIPFDARFPGYDPLKWNEL